MAAAARTRPVQVIEYEGRQIPVDLEWDAEYVGDPPEIRGSCRVTVADVCPECSADSAWSAEYRETGDEWITCETCGSEFRVKAAQ